MFYQKKLDRAMKWLKERNKSQNNSYSTEEELEDARNNVEFEKKDILAIIISALLVFGPLFLVGIGLLVLLFR